MNKLLNTSALTIAEQNELERCEVVIKQGLETFVEVGTALMVIRNNRLYRAGYSTFEDYCREMWGMARQTAYQLIEASKVIENVRHGGQILPASERQTRPLTSLQPEIQREAWREVVETHGNDITAAKVREVVDYWKSIDEEIRQAKEEPMFAAQNPTEIIEQARNRPHVANNSGENEWYTPSEYIEAARRVMGGIDLDPASSDTAQENVRALTYYTIETNGLSQRWSGRVWLNPPYGGGLIDPFTQKLIGHIQRGEVAQAIVLVNNATETGWFQDLAAIADAICFSRGRIKYLSISGVKNSPLQGQAFLFFGGMVSDFIREFQTYGICVTTA